MGRIQEIINRIGEIRTALTSDVAITKEQMDAYETELRDLKAEKGTIEKRSAMAAELNADPTLAENRGSFNNQPQPSNPQINPQAGENRTVQTPNGKIELRVLKKQKQEERGKILKEARIGEHTGVKLAMLDWGMDEEERVISLGSSSIILPTHFSQDIKDVFNQVSNLMHMVRVMPLMGGESYEKPWVDNYGLGSETVINADSHDIETTFGLSEIRKSLITAYQDWPREITKLASAPYETYITEGITVAMRKRMNRQIMIGNGTANNLTGIFDNGATMTALDDANDLEVSAGTGITGTTLEEIVFSYGGDEDVEDMAYLLLNKQTLRQYVSVRDEEGRPFYEVMLMGNTGTIKRRDGGIMVSFIINSTIPALSSTLDNDAYFMAYGNLSNYELAIFSDAEVMRSEDFRFKSRQISYCGEVYAGGNVVKKDGFVRVKKVA